MTGGCFCGVLWDPEGWRMTACKTYTCGYWFWTDDVVNGDNKPVFVPSPGKQTWHETHADSRGIAGCQNCHDAEGKQREIIFMKHGKSK